MIEAGDRFEGLRLVGPPVETIKLEVEFEAADRTPAGATSDPNGVAGDLAAEARRAALRTLEILPASSPLVLLALGPGRVLPVRLTDLRVVEEAFDLTLRPIRAKVTMTLRVLNTDDLPPGSNGAALFVAA